MGHANVTIVQYFRTTYSETNIVSPIPKEAVGNDPKEEEKKIAVW